MITYESGEESVFASDKEESFRNGEQKIKSDYIIVDGENGEIIDIYQLNRTTEASPVAFGNKVLLGTRSAMHLFEIL